MVQNDSDTDAKADVRKGGCIRHSLHRCVHAVFVHHPFQSGKDSIVNRVFGIMLGKPGCDVQITYVKKGLAGIAQSFE